MILEQIVVDVEYEVIFVDGKTVEVSVVFEFGVLAQFHLISPKTLPNQPYYLTEKERMALYSFLDEEARKTKTDTVDWSEVIRGRSKIYMDLPADHKLKQVIESYRIVNYRYDYTYEIVKL